MMTLVASCERHVPSATIDVGASIASTYHHRELSSKAENASSHKAKKFSKSEAELFDVVLLSNVRPRFSRNELAKNSAFSQKETDTRNLNNVAAGFSGVDKQKLVALV